MVFTVKATYRGETRKLSVSLYGLLLAAAHTYSSFLSRTTRSRRLSRFLTRFVSLLRN